MTVYVGDILISKTTRRRYRVEKRYLEGGLWKFSMCAEQPPDVTIPCTEKEIETKFLVPMPLHKQEISQASLSHPTNLTGNFGGGW